MPLVNVSPSGLATMRTPMRGPSRLSASSLPVGTGCGWSTLVEGPPALRLCWYTRSSVRIRRVNSTSVRAAPSRDGAF